MKGSVTYMNLIRKSSTSQGLQNMNPNVNVSGGSQVSSRFANISGDCENYGGEYERIERKKARLKT